MLARQIAIGFGIAIIFPLLVYYGIATIYPPPKRVVVPSVTLSLPERDATAEDRQKYRVEEEKRREERQKSEETYNAAAREFARRMVIISTPLGVAAIFIGAYISLFAIGTGLIFGGIFSVASGYWGYWNFLEDWVRFVSLLAGFLILLFVGYFRVARAASP